jgi:hypothetical protein
MWAGRTAGRGGAPPHLCLGTYGDPRGVGVSYERGTSVKYRWPLFERCRGYLNLRTHTRRKHTVN